MKKLDYSERALRDLFTISQWYLDQSGSNSVAERWEQSCLLALETVCDHPERAMPLPENDVMEHELHQITFGSGRRKTHRAILRFEGETIHVLSIRHLMQRDIEPEDLAG